MKIIAFFKLKEDIELTKAIAFLAAEEALAWQFYLQDKLRESYLTSQPGVVIDIFEYPSMDAFYKDMDELPLMKAGMMDITAYDLLPFKNIEFLFKEDYKSK